MELAAILIVPALASGLSLLPIGRQFGAPITVVASAIVLALTVPVAIRAAGTGSFDVLDGWLTCDGLAALVLGLLP